MLIRRNEPALLCEIVVVRGASKLLYSIAWIHQRKKKIPRKEGKRERKRYRIIKVRELEARKEISLCHDCFSLKSKFILYIYIWSTYIYYNFLKCYYFKDKQMKSKFGGLLFPLEHQSVHYVFLYLCWQGTINVG